MRIWTAEEVRREHPDVRVYIIKTREEYTATVRGDRRASVGGKNGSHAFHVTWAQIAGALNAGRPLTV